MRRRRRRRGGGEGATFTHCTILLPSAPFPAQKTQEVEEEEEGKEGTLPPGGAARGEKGLGARGRREMWNIMCKFKIERDLNWENAPLHTS